VQIYPIIFVIFRFFTSRSLENFLKNREINEKFEKTCKFLPEIYRFAENLQVFSKFAQILDNFYEWKSLEFFEISKINWEISRFYKFIWENFEFYNFNWEIIKYIK
jgi:hypothetical protein